MRFTESALRSQRGPSSLWSAAGALVVFVVATTIAIAGSRAYAAPLFTERFPSYDTGISPFSVAIGDLNGDGWSDLVTANNAANTVSVLLGNRFGTFGPETDFGKIGRASCRERV